MPIAQLAELPRVLTKNFLERDHCSHQPRARPKKLEPPFKESVIKANKKWDNIEVWQAMKITSQDLTPGFYATARDGRYTVDQGFVRQDENRQIYVKLFWRTMLISATVMGFCLLLGYPVAYLLATLPLRSSNLLMIMVLLPF